MNKKFLLKTGVLLLAALFPVLASGKDSPNYPNPNVYLSDESGLTAVWNKDADDGTCWICHPGDDMEHPGVPYSGKVVIPEYILGRRVVGIQRDAFKDNVNVTEIVISGTVMEIAGHAFDGCTGLRVVSFLHGEGVINVGFSGESGQRGAFVSSQIDSLYIDREITFSSSSGPFEKSALRVIAIGPNVEKIGKETFSWIPALKRLVIPATCKEFGLNCFQYTSIEEMVIESSDEILNVGGWKDSRMWNPSSSAFSSCGFKRLDIDRPTTGLGGISKLEELRLGPNAGTFSFQNAGKLVKADIACKVIQGKAFSGCEALKELYLREGVRSIGRSAFSHCKSLKELSLPDSYVANKGSGNEVFIYCTGLKTIENLNTSYIPDNMFSNCDSIEEVVFGEKVDTIGRSVFSNCTNLKKIVIPGTVSRFEWNPFSNNDSIGTIIMEDGEEYTFDNCRIWENPVRHVYFGRQINYNPNDWRYVGYSPFANGIVDTSAEFGPMVKKIGYSYFRNCKNLREVIIGPGVALIEKDAFRDCVSLEEINIPSNVKEIQTNAFLNCKNLKRISFGDVSSPQSRSDEACIVATNAFNSSPAITEIIIKGGMPDLNTGAFHENVYTSATLTVPEGMSAAYSAHPEWGRFSNITEDITTGIDLSVAPGSDSYDVFSLQGVELLHNADSAELRNLAPGIYIVRSRDGVRKIVKK